MSYELQNLPNALVSIRDVMTVNEKPQRLLCAPVCICDEIHNSSFIIHN